MRVIGIDIGTTSISAVVAEDCKVRLTRVETVTCSTLVSLYIL